MVVAYVLQPPKPGTTTLFPVTLVLSDRTLVTKKAMLIPDWRKFASAAAARAHLDDVIRAHERAGYKLVETREVEEEIPPERFGSGLEIAFDIARKRMTVVFGGKLGESPSAEMLETISTRLRKYEPRCLHVAPFSWSGPQLAKALIPSLEAFIFEGCDTIARQSHNTLGDISDVLEACPELKRAFITGCSTMRKTRHERLCELYLIGNPLHPSVMTALVASTFPALETLMLSQYWRGFQAVDLVRSLRSIEAPRLSHIYVDGVSVLEFLTAIGTVALPWSLWINAPSFDDVDGLLEVLEKHDALRSGKLRLRSDEFFDSEVARLQEMGVTVEDTRVTYADW